MICEKSGLLLLLIIGTGKQANTPHLTVQVSSDVLFLAETVRRAERELRRFVTQHQSITVGQARDLFRSSRKYVLNLLEYLDKQGVTRREGDARVLVD